MYTHSMAPVDPYTFLHVGVEKPEEAKARLEKEDMDLCVDEAAERKVRMDRYQHLYQAIGQRKDLTLLELIKDDDAKKIALYLSVYPQWTTQACISSGKNLFHALAHYNSYKTIAHLIALDSNNRKKGRQSLFDLQNLTERTTIDRQSNTALMVAVENNAYEATQELLKLQGAGLTLKNTDNKTAKDLASTPEMQALFNPDPFSVRTVTLLEIIQLKGLKLIFTGTHEDHFFVPIFQDQKKYCKVDRSKSEKAAIETNHDEVKQAHDTLNCDTDLAELLDQQEKVLEEDIAEVRKAFSENAKELQSNDLATVTADHARLLPYAELRAEIGSKTLLNLILADDYKKILKWLAVHTDYWALKRHDGKTLYHLLAQHNSFKTIRYLGTQFMIAPVGGRVTNHAPLFPWKNTLDNNQNTPLMDAVAHNAFAAAEELIKFKVRINVRNIEGKTALDMAKTPYMKDLLYDAIASELEADKRALRKKMCKDFVRNPLNTLRLRQFFNPYGMIKPIVSNLTAKRLLHDAGIETHNKGAINDSLLLLQPKYGMTRDD